MKFHTNAEATYKLRKSSYFAFYELPCCSWWHLLYWNTPPSLRQCLLPVTSFLLSHRTVLLVGQELHLLKGLPTLQPCVTQLKKSSSSIAGTQPPCSHPGTCESCSRLDSASQGFTGDRPYLKAIKNSLEPLARFMRFQDRCSYSMRYPQHRGCNT